MGTVGKGREEVLYQYSLEESLGLSLMSALVTQTAFVDG